MRVTTAFRTPPHAQSTVCYWLGDGEVNRSITINSVLMQHNLLYGHIVTTCTQIDVKYEDTVWKLTDKCLLRGKKCYNMFYKNILLDPVNEGKMDSLAIDSPANILPTWAGNHTDNKEASSNKKIIIGTYWALKTLHKNIKITHKIPWKLVAVKIKPNKTIANFTDIYRSILLYSLTECM